MFVVEAVYRRPAPLHDCMVVREFTSFEAAKMFAKMLATVDCYEVKALREKITYEPTWEDVTMDGRYGCD